MLLVYYLHQNCYFKMNKYANYITLKRNISILTIVHIIYKVILYYKNDGNYISFQYFCNIIFSLVLTLYIVIYN